MSFDLYFYKHKNSTLTENQIADYLNNCFVEQNNAVNEWFFESANTEVYFSIHHDEHHDDPESVDPDERYSDFDDVYFSFNLNFMRPAFFGLEAFLFVKQFMSDLDLFVVNPQSDKEFPYQPTKEELFENWNEANLRISADYFEKMQSAYMPLTKSNDAWEYNFYRKVLQDELGDAYFVPKLFFFKPKADNNVITIASWAEHMPTLIPPADYFVLTKRYKKFFREVKETALVDRKTLMEEFGSYMQEYDFKDCKVIHPKNALAAEKKFNSIKSIGDLNDFAERLAMDKMYNAKP